MTTSHPTATVEADEDGMDIDQPNPPNPPNPSPPTITESWTPATAHLSVLVRDEPNWLSNAQGLKETDVIVLLTPVVIPISKDPTDTSDPFEPLGRSLAKRHARVRHVPYTSRNGITSTHLGFIKRGHVIILCFAVRPGQPLPLEYAKIAIAVSDNKPCIVVVCCTPMESIQSIPFQTLIRTNGYSPAALEATAALMFGEYQAQLPEPEPVTAPITNTLQVPARLELSHHKVWTVTEWNETRDMESVLRLWTQNVSSRFSMDYQTFAALLRRPGYAKHYVVRDSRTEEILGFCATYLSYVDQEGEKLIASLSILLVRGDSRNKGVGLSLHSHAMDQLRKTRGVVRLQLGSTFPRIFFGPPQDMQFNEEWFKRRGWQLSANKPGQGQTTYDMVLDFKKWRNIPYDSSAHIVFRLCTQEDMGKVLELVEEVSTRRGTMGWFDQYSSLMNGPNVKDVVLGIDRGQIIATALTYTPSCGSQITGNLPWASRIGHDVGGVTCICIPPPNAAITIIGLLNSCVKNLQTQGMKRMFIDGVSNGFDDLRNLGFEEWARYKDVWKDTGGLLPEI